MIMWRGGAIVPTHSQFRCLLSGAAMPTASVISSQHSSTQNLLVYAHVLFFRMNYAHIHHYSQLTTCNNTDIVSSLHINHHTVEVAQIQGKEKMLTIFFICLVSTKKKCNRSWCEEIAAYIFSFLFQIFLEMFLGN